MPSLDGPTPIPGIQFISHDLVTGAATFLTTSRELVFSHVTATEDPGLLTRVVHFPESRLVEISGKGMRVSMKVGNPATCAAAPVVYLDQNHWIAFACWVKDHSQVSTDDAVFFAELADGCESGQLVVPLSSAHLAETSKRGGRSRLDVARVMLRFSQGWQFRHVLALRRAEIRTLFGTSGPVSRSLVVSLDPEVVLDKAPNEALAPELPPTYRDAHRRVLWSMVLARLLFDDGAMPRPAEDMSSRWANSFRPLSEALAGNACAKARSRDVSRIRFMTDIHQELGAAASEAGLSPEEFAAWVENDAETAFRRAPGLSRLREVLHHRLWNAHERWEGNDLNDWLYLSFAGAYTDLVVGERKMINYLRLVGKSVPPGAVLHRRAGEALGDLRALLQRV